MKKWLRILIKPEICSELLMLFKEVECGIRRAEVKWKKEGLWWTVSSVTQSWGVFSQPCLESLGQCPAHHRYTINISLNKWKFNDWIKTTLENFWVGFVIWESGKSREVKWSYIGLSLILVSPVIWVGTKFEETESCKFRLSYPDSETSFYDGELESVLTTETSGFSKSQVPEIQAPALTLRLLARE